MSLAVRVIPCLDVDAGRVVKGVNFVDLRDAGDPVEMARVYDAEGADELTFLDITASSGDRATTYDVVSRTAESVFIPLTVGGRRAQRRRRRPAAARRRGQGRGQHRCRGPAGADRRDRRPVRQPGARAVAGRPPLPRRRGRPTPGSRSPRTADGAGTGQDAVEWCVRAAGLGAGEILLNSMDADGTRAGFDTDLIRPGAPRGVGAADRQRGSGRGRALRTGGRGGGGRRPRGQRLPLRRPAHRRREGRPRRRGDPRPARRATHRSARRPSRGRRRGGRRPTAGAPAARPRPPSRRAPWRFSSPGTSERRSTTPRRPAARRA